MEPPVDFYERVQNLLHMMPSKIDEYQNLLTGNPIWISRTKGVGYLSPEDAIALGVTGPPLRASGVDWDLRRDMPYSGYEKFKFKVPVSTDGDVWARYIVRMEEMRESVRICQQALDGMPDRPPEGRRAQGGSSRPRGDEDPDGVAHLSLQDRHRRLRSALPARSIRRSNRRAGRWVTTSSPMARQSRIAYTCAIRRSRRCRQWTCDVRRQTARGCRRGHRLD